MKQPGSALSLFHPLIGRWFAQRYGAPTEVQGKAWPIISGGHHILMTAPTGSGKTLSAFLWGLNQLIREAWASGHVRILYVSPLKALNNDIRVNLLQPLAELRKLFLDCGEPFPDIHVQTRSGDTPSADRQRMLRRPPEILITTPESLNILLSSLGGRKLLTHIETVILDEIHAVASNKRGTHLITAVERIVPLSGEFQRIALSATVKPLDTIARFIGGLEMVGKNLYRKRDVSIVRAASAKGYDIRVSTSPGAVNAQDPEIWWNSLVDALRSRIEKNRATLIFANSRRFTEKLTRLINAADAHGGDTCTAYAHHGSLSREIRHLVENRFKKGELKSIVSTSSLELGIDIGELDEVILVQAPFSVSSALQRIGRAGHGVEEVSRAALFPLFSRDYLNSAVIARAVMEGDIEETRIPLCPLDVLSQVIVSMTGVESLSVDDLFDRVRTSYPYHDLGRDQFDLVLQMLAGKYEDTKIRELRPRISLDPISGCIRSREGSLRALYMAGGTIPDRGYYSLRVSDSGAKIGELDEEFVWERSVGDVFTFGTQQWRIVRVDHQNVEVAPAAKQASMAPFWKADLNGRDFHLSDRIGAFLEEIDAFENLDGASAKLSDRYYMDEVSVDRLLVYLAAQRKATGTGLPHRHRIVVEHIAGLENRSDSRQVILHAVWGGRVLIPYAIALKQAWKERFGSSLSIYHDNDTMLIGIPAGSTLPPLRELLTLVTPDNVEMLLRKKLEQTGIFGALFRQNASRALLLPKKGFNQRTPLWLNRIRSRKLLQAVYGYRDFPLLVETWRSCLQDLFDMVNLNVLLQELEQHDIEIVESYPLYPSPFAAEIMHWQTFTHMYEDDTPGVLAESGLSDRILRDAVFSSSLRPGISQDIIDFLGERLNRTAAGYTPDSPDDLYDWVHERILIPVDETRLLINAMVRDHGAEASDWLGMLADRVVEISLPDASSLSLITLENVRIVLEALFVPGEEGQALLGTLATQWLRYYGPIEESRLAGVWGVNVGRLDDIIETMLEEKNIVRDSFREGDNAVEICDAENMERLLRMVRSRGRREFKPLPLAKLPLFLATRQGLVAESLDEVGASHSTHDGGRQQEELQACLDRLFGYPAKASVWEEAIFPARMRRYDPVTLNLLFQQSDLIWFGTGRERLSFCFGYDRVLFHSPNADGAPSAAADGVAVAKNIIPDASGKYGFLELLTYSGIDHSVLQGKLWDLVWIGMISNDSFEPVRKGAASGFKASQEVTSRAGMYRTRHRANRWQVSHPLQGNWFVLNTEHVDRDLLDEEELSRERARQLLARYGVLFREILQQELPGLRWGRVFRSLRLMELSGEVIAGYFFENVPGLQFASHEAYQELAHRLPADAVYWMNATDPASLCGIRIEGLGLPMPRRVSSNYLVFHGERLVLSLGRNGRDVFIYVPHQEKELFRYLHIFHVLLNRQVNPLSQIKVQNIDGQPALESEYTGRFIAFGFEKGYRDLTLRRGYR
jgi:ATP-dependent Lhr-like helicase